MKFTLTITSPDGTENAALFDRKQAQAIMDHLDGNKDYMRVNFLPGDNDIWIHKDGCHLELAAEWTDEQKAASDAALEASNDSFNDWGYWNGDDR